MSLISDFEATGGNKYQDYVGPFVETLSDFLERNKVKFDIKQGEEAISEEGKGAGFQREALITIYSDDEAKVIYCEALMAYMGHNGFLSGMVGLKDDPTESFEWSCIMHNNAPVGGGLTRRQENFWKQLHAYLPEFLGRPLIYENGIFPEQTEPRMAGTDL